MKSVRFIKENNDNFTYGKYYRVIDSWGDFSDYIVLDDNMKAVKTFKHLFEDEFYLYQSDLHEMAQVSHDQINIKTNRGTIVNIRAAYSIQGGSPYLEITEKEDSE
ncbi:hypothetical protein EBB07_28975 [Paenibacillaceae bacterium]|nr:hypothetical protein EBB07_28975 [Paenibacillaceae bacterium]